MSADEPCSPPGLAGGSSTEALLEQAKAMAVQDAVAYLRSMQTIAVATSALLRRRLLDGREAPSTAAEHVMAAERVVRDSVEGAFVLYQRALELAETPKRRPDDEGS